MKEYISTIQNSDANDPNNDLVSIHMADNIFKVYMSGNYSNDEQIHNSNSLQAILTNRIYFLSGLNIIFGQSRSGKTFLIEYLLGKFNEFMPSSDILTLKLDEFDEFEISEIPSFSASSDELDILSLFKAIMISGSDTRKIVFIDSIKCLLYGGNPSRNLSLRRGGISNNFIADINTVNNICKLLGVVLVCTLSPSSIDYTETMQVLSTIVGATRNIICCVQPGLVYRDSPESGTRLSNKFLNKIYS